MKEILHNTGNNYCVHAVKNYRRAARAHVHFTSLARDVISGILY